MNEMIVEHWLSFLGEWCYRHSIDGEVIEDVPVNSQRGNELTQHINTTEWQVGCGSREETGRDGFWSRTSE